MLSLERLFSLLSTLTLLSIALTGLESAPAAAARIAAQPAVHHRNSARRNSLLHRHLALRHRSHDHLAARDLFSHSSPNGLIKRKADGTMCRVRGQKGSFAAASSSAVSTTTTTSSADAASTTSTADSVAAVQQTSIVQSQAGDQNWAAPTSAAAPAAASSQSSGSSGGSSYSGGGSGWANSGNKLGLGWPNGDWDAQGSSGWIGNFVGSKSSWYYTWSPFSVGHADSLGLEFVPMLWGPKQLSDWHAQQASWPNTVKNALFFNEPNQAGQCDMSASDSVSTWMNDYLPLRSKGIALGGAATTSAPDGLQWVLDFKTACVNAGNSDADCSASFIPIHWYDTTAENFQAYVQNFHAKTGMDIWITEYACQNFNGGAQCSDSETWALHQTMAAWFDSQDYVKRYAPFGVMRDMQGVNQDNALMNSDGSISSLGAWYISSA